MSKSDGKTVLTAVLIGAAAGYVAGLLTAPKSGKETREDIARVSKKIKQDVTQKLHEAREDLGAVIEEATVKARELGAKGRQELEGLVVKAKAAQAKAKDVLSAVKNGEAEDKELNKALSEAISAKRHLINYLKRPNE